MLRQIELKDRIMMNTFKKVWKVAPVNEQMKRWENVM